MADYSDLFAIVLLATVNKAPFRTMVSKIGMSIRFLDLPLELQRFIFEKCFNEDWNVHTIRKSCDSSSKPVTTKNGKHQSPAFCSKEGENHIVFKFDVSLGLLLVNRHFSEEGKRAMALSKRGTYHIYERLTNPECTVTFWDPAVTNLDANESDHLKMPLIKSWKQRFPNLMRITAGKCICLDSPYSGNFLTPRNLRDLLSDDRDDQVAALATADFDDMTGNYESLPNLSIAWTYSLNIRAYGRPRWWIAPEVQHILEAVTVLSKSSQDLWLHTKFSIDPQACRIVERYFTFSNDGLDRLEHLNDAMDIVLAKVRTMNEADEI